MSRCVISSSAKVESTNARPGLLSGWGEVDKVVLGRQHDVIRESSECAAPLGPLGAAMRTAQRPCELWSHLRFSVAMLTTPPKSGPSDKKGDDEIGVLVTPQGRLQISADLDVKGLRKLKQMLEQYEQILKLLQ